MRSKMCPEFQEWLERLPRQTLSPSFSRHLEICEKCRTAFESLIPTVTSLLSEKKDIKLSDNQINQLTALTLETALKQRNRAVIKRLGFVSLLTLPFIVALNWFLGSLGYKFIASYISPSIAKGYFVLFIAGAVILFGIIYSSVLLAIGWIRGQKSKESIL